MLMTVGILLPSCHQREVEKDAAPGSAASAAAPTVTGVPSVRYTVCSEEFSQDRLKEMFNGNLVFAAEQVERGESLSGMIGWTVLSLITNGLTFDEPYEYEISAGDYSLMAGSTGYQFSFYAASAFGNYAEGEKITDDLFALSSYVKELGISGFPPAVTYDEGPLFDLIDGDISFDETNPLDIGVELKLSGSLLKFALNTRGEYRGAEPRTDDLLTLVVANTPVTLTSLAAQVETGGFGLDYDGTGYQSLYYSLAQSFGASAFLIRSDDRGYYWEGEFTSAIEKNGTWLYQSGLLSQRLTNYADYFCDEEKNIRIGRATHDADLSGGIFLFDSGESFPYGLEEF